MKKSHLLSLNFCLIFILISWTTDISNWIVENHTGYKLCYTEPDKENIDEYLTYFDNGIKSVQKFFDIPYKKEFGIYIHPNRLSLDIQWRKDWNMPDFKSECWMVASGVAGRLDIISPRSWDKEACEHSFSDKTEIQQIITHELVHVFHGQLNISPDFSDITGIDWFVEGLATYVSGQCDSSSFVEIKKTISENKVPLSLDSFWTGKLKYRLSGSLVLYIDEKFGRAKLIEILRINRKDELLNSLGITEQELLTGWAHYIGNL